MRAIVVCILVLGLLAAPAAAKHTDDNPGNDDETPCHPETPFDEQCAKACPQDGWGGLKCAIWREVEQGYWCSLVNAGELPGTVRYLVQAIRDDAYPLIKHQKCEAVEDSNALINWSNNDVHQWTDRWLCYLWDTEPTWCPEDVEGPGLPFWTFDQVTCIVESVWSRPVSTCQATEPPDPPGAPPAPPV